MEIIRKIINIDDFRSRTIGIMPYIEYNSTDSSFVINSAHNGNYGGFPANPIIDGKTENYMDMMRKYHYLKSLFRNGLKLKKVIKNGKQTWVTGFNERKIIYDYIAYNINDFDSEGNVYVTDNNIESDFIVLTDDIETYIKYGGFDFVKYMDEEYIGVYYIPSNVECVITTDSSFYYEIGCPDPGIKMPEFIYYADIESELEWMNNHYILTNPCMLKMWEEKGGQAYIDILNKQKGIYELKKQQFIEKQEDNLLSVPYINLPVLLTQEYNDIGLMSSYDDTPYDNKFDFLGYQHDDLRKVNSLLSDFIVESRLNELRSKDFFVDDEGNYLPGLFKEYNQFHYVENGVIVEREVLDTQIEVYETFTLKQTIPNDYSGIAFIRYINDSENVMTIPYLTDKIFNAYAIKQSDLASYISITPHSIVFNRGVKEAKLIVDALKPWTLNIIEENNEDKDWGIFCDVESGAEGITEITVSHTHDDIIEGRALIKFSDGKSTTECGITLKPIEALITLINGTLYEYLVDYTGGVYTIIFNATSDWKIECPIWCSCNIDSNGKGINVVEITVNANESRQRSGNIKISLTKKPDVYENITIKQGSEEYGDFVDMINVRVDLSNGFILYNDYMYVNDIAGVWASDDKPDIGMITTFTRPVNFEIFNEEYGAVEHAYAIAKASFEWWGADYDYRMDVAQITIEWVTSGVNLELPDMESNGKPNGTIKVRLSDNEDDNFTMDGYSNSISATEAKLKGGKYTIKLPPTQISVKGRRQ